MSEDTIEMRQVEQALTQRVLDFWFGEEGSDAFGSTRAEWFKKDAAFDDQIRDQFSGNVEQALGGGFSFMTESGKGCLALVILLDQFPRNLYRGAAKAFAGDKKALQLAKEAVTNGFDKEFPHSQQMFFYLPFEHSEILRDQQRCLDLFQAAGNDDMMKWAQAHYDIIARFGRFPHRNEALGRESTAEELAFLEEPNSSF